MTAVDLGKLRHIRRYSAASKHAQRENKFIVNRNTS